MFHWNPFYISVFALICLISFPEAFALEEIFTAPSGRIRMLKDEGVMRDITTDIRVFSKGWKEDVGLAAAKNVKRRREGRARKWLGELKAPDGTILQYSQSVKLQGNEAELTIRLKPEQALSGEGVFLYFYLPIDLYRNGHCCITNGNGRKASGFRAAEFPADKRSKVRFLNTEGRGFQAWSQGGDNLLQLNRDEAAAFIVQDERKWGTHKYAVLIPLMEPDIAPGEVTKKRFELRFSAYGKQAPVNLELFPDKDAFRFLGFGGNFVFGQEEAVTIHNLEHLSPRWGRVGMNLRDWEPRNDNADPDRTDWNALREQDQPGSKLRRNLKRAALLAKRDIPYIISVWQIPEFLTKNPGQHRDARPREIPRTKWPEFRESICSYLLYLKRKYDAEPVVFSLNEPDMGVNVKQTPEEHRDWIIKLGKAFRRNNLQTKLLLGDVSGGSSTAFIEEAANSKDARGFVGALSFHTWRGNPDQYREWRALSERFNLPLIAGEVGWDPSAYKDDSFNSFPYFLHELRMYQELLLYAHPQIMLEWQYTDNYGFIEVAEGAQGDTNTLIKKPRYWMIKQYSSFTPQPGIAVETETSDEHVLLTAFRSIGTSDKNEPYWTFHISNTGPATKIFVQGIPENVENLRRYVMTWETGSQPKGEVEVNNNRFSCRLFPYSLTTFTTRP